MLGVAHIIREIENFLMKRSILTASNYLRDPRAHLNLVYLDTIYCPILKTFFDRFIDRHGSIYFEEAKGPVIIEV